MKAVWVTRSFLDYRIPVFREVSRRFEDHFTLIYNASYVPDRCRLKAGGVLGNRARGLRGERSLKAGPQNGFANKGIRIPYQPGLVRAVLEEEPDLLISDGFFQWTYAALWVRATRHVPHVMCYEKTHHTERHAQWYRAAYRKTALRWIDAICCNGRLCGAYTQSLGFPPDRITYGHMVVDVEGLRAGAAAVSDGQIAEIAARHRLRGVVFLYVGRLIPLKGLAELLTAWKRFTAEATDLETTLLLVGDGPLSDELQRRCRSEGLTNVSFAGPVDYDRLPVYYRCADALVMPTLEDNWSLVVAEGMACGLPILCSRYNGCWPELITGANGWVFDPLLPESLTDALREAAASRARLARMGEKSRAIISMHSPEHAAQAIYEAGMYARRRIERRHACAPCTDDG